MAGITGLGTTFNLPNYVGELFNISPEDTPFLSAIGGLTGGVSVNSTVFTWSSYDLRDAADDRQRVEGADAPTAEGRVRANGSNVLEIHQEQVSVTYTKQAATNQFAGTAPFVGGVNAVQDELAWQLQQEFKQIARDVEASFITGTYQMPANNSTPRKTRGVLEAIETNVVDCNDAVLTADDVLDLMQEVWENGGIQESETRTLLVNAALKRKLATLDGKIDRLVGLIAEDVDAAPAYRRAIAGMEAERVAVGGELAEATRAARQATVVPLPDDPKLSLSASR